MKLAFTTVMVFHALIQRQEIFPAPTGIAQRCPAIVVCALAAHINHAVDRRTAAQHATTRITELATIQSGISLSAVTPIGARVADAVQIANGDMDPVPVILAAGLKQQHTIFRIGRQAISQYTACRACTNDDVIKVE